MAGLCYRANYLVKLLEGLQINASLVRDLQNGNAAANSLPSLLRNWAWRRLPRIRLRKHPRVNDGLSRPKHLFQGYASVGLYCSSHCLDPSCCG